MSSCGLQFFSDFFKHYWRFLKICNKQNQFYKLQIVFNMIYFFRFILLNPFCTPEPRLVTWSILVGLLDFNQLRQIFLARHCTVPGKELAAHIFSILFKRKTLTQQKINKIHTKCEVSGAHIWYEMKKVIPSHSWACSPPLKKTSAANSWPGTVRSPMMMVMFWNERKPHVIIYPEINWFRTKEW
jgi:hypothetical protein